MLDGAVICKRNLVDIIYHIPRWQHVSQNWSVEYI